MKANQAFKQADEAVSPVIGVILMVAITVVLAAVVFVLVSNLSKTSDKAEDVAFKADSPLRGQIHVTMIKMGTNGPYSIDTDTADATDTTSDDISVIMDGEQCDIDIDTTLDAEEFKSLSGFDTAADITEAANGAQWAAGEVMIFNTDCDASSTAVNTCTTDGGPNGSGEDCLISSSEHRIQVSVRGTLVFEGNVIVR